MSIKKNTFLNLLGFGVPALVGVISIPFLLHKMGTEAFGVFTLVGTIIGYLSIFDFGLGNALTQQVAANRALGRENEIPALIKVGFIFTFMIGAAAGVFIFAFSVDIAEAWLGAGSRFTSDAIAALVITAVAVPFTTTTSALRGVLEGNEDFRTVNVLRVAQGSLNFLLPLVFVYCYSNSISSAVSSILLLRVVIFISYVKHSVIRSSLFSTDKIKVKAHVTLFSTGAWITLANIVSPLMVTCDRFFISPILGAASVSIYTVPLEALMRLLILPTAISNALLPRLAALDGTDSGLRDSTYRRAYITNAAVLTILALILAFNAGTILELWIGREFAMRSESIFVILTVGIFFNGLAHVPYAAIQARGKARASAIARVVEASAYIPCLIVCINYFGLIGAAVAWAVRALIDLIILQVIEVATRQKTNPKLNLDHAPCDVKLR